MIEYPYTDFHEMNLDWILKTVKNAAGEVEDLQEWADDAELRLTILENMAGTYYASDSIDKLLPAGSSVTIDTKTISLSGIYVVTVKVFMPPDLNPDSEDNPSYTGSYSPEVVQWLFSRGQIVLYDSEDNIKMIWDTTTPRANRGDMTITALVAAEPGDKISLRYAVDRAYSSVDGTSITRHDEYVQGRMWLMRIATLPNIGG